MDKIKDVLEIIYFISTPLLVLFAYKALGQIKMAKDQIEESRTSRKLNSKRESYKLAAEKCDHFLNILIPQMNSIDKKLEKEESKFFDKSEVIIDNENIIVEPSTTEPEALVKLILDIPILDLLNALEGFAVFFVSGVADEKVAFLTIGRTYCNTVRKFLPLIVPLSDNGEHFVHTLKLFTIWNSRIEKDNLEKEKAEIDKKLKKTQSVKINPIGTTD